MEDKPLNMAHQQHRRADAHIKNKRFDDAIQCHNNAAELLLDAMKSTSSSHALESISLQHSYHLKQKDFIKARKEQYERVKKAMDNLKHISHDPLSEITQHEANVQIAIYRIIQEADSLLEILRKCETNDESSLAEKLKKEDKSIVVETVFLCELNPPNSPEAYKHKNQNTAVEKLLILNQSLHNFVDKLVMQVELVKEENSTLKDRVEYLEAERKKYLVLSNIDMTQQANFGLFSDVNYSLEENSDRSYPPTEFQAECVERNESYSRPSSPAGKPTFDLTAFTNHNE